MKDKKKNRYTFRVLLIADIVLAVIAVVILICLYFSAVSNRQVPESTVEEETFQPSETAQASPEQEVSASPSPSPSLPESVTPVASPTPTPISYESYQAENYQFTYVPALMTLTLRNGDIQAVSVQSAEDIVPRMDVQILHLSGLPAMTDFLQLAVWTVDGYYADSPEMTVLEQSAEGQSLRAVLQIPATEQSPALEAEVLLTAGAQNSVLAVELLPDTLEETEKTIWQEMLDSVTAVP